MYIIFTRHLRAPGARGPGPRAPPPAEPMAPEAMDRGPLDAGFSSAKKAVLMMLKRAGTSSLADVARELGVTKMAALRHVNVLEGKGLVERSFVAGGRGRAHGVFRLAPRAPRRSPA